MHVGAIFLCNGLALRGRRTFGGNTKVTEDNFLAKGCRRPGPTADLSKCFRLSWLRVFR